MKITRMPAEIAMLKKDNKILALDSVNLEKNIFYDVIQEGKELLEFGDDLDESSYEMYLFDNKEYSDLVLEFLKKNSELKKKKKDEKSSEYSIVEGSFSPERNKRFRNYQIRVKNTNKGENESSDEDVSNMQDCSSMNFNFILNLKS